MEEKKETLKKGGRKGFRKGVGTLAPTDSENATLYATPAQKPGPGLAVRRSLTVLQTLAIWPLVWQGVQKKSAQPLNAHARLPMAVSRSITGTGKGAEP